MAGIKSDMRNPKVCINCGGDISKGGHYVPPGFGDKGLWACKSFYPEFGQAEKIVKIIRENEVKWHFFAVECETNWHDLAKILAKELKKDAV